MVRHQSIDGAVGQGFAQCIAITLLTQWRRYARTAVKVTHIGIGQVQGVDADIASDGQPICFGLAHQGHPRSAADAAQVHMGFGAFEQFKDGVQGNGFCGYGYARQTHACGQGATGRHTFAQMQFLRTQPHGVAK